MSTQDPWQIVADVSLLAHSPFDDNLDTIVNPAMDALEALVADIPVEFLHDVAAVTEERIGQVARARLYRPTAEQYKAAVLAVWHEALDQVKAEAEGTE